MSIINDALKKVQQEQVPKANETTPPVSNLFATPTPGSPQDDKSPIEYLPSAPKKNISIPALIFAIALGLGSFVFLFKQINTYFPRAQKSANTAFYKLINKTPPAVKPKPPKELVPLAKLTVNAPQTPNPTGITSLNIHGIMSNGTSPVVLINDQVYQEGDLVDGVKIVKISLDRITVINNGVTQNISVKN